MTEGAEGGQHVQKHNAYEMECPFVNRKCKGSKCMAFAKGKRGWLKKWMEGEDPNSKETVQLYTCAAITNKRRTE